MKFNNKKIVSLLMAASLAFTGISYEANQTLAAEGTNVVNIASSAAKNYVFMTSNANNGSEGFLTIDNGFSSINSANEDLGNGNNMLGKTATTSEVGIYINLKNDYDISSALIYQGSTNANYTDSYCKQYSVYYSTEEVNSSNQGNITWNLAGTCNNGTIYTGAKISSATNTSSTGDSISFSNTYTARSIKVVFDKNSCMGTGTNGQGTGVTGTVSLLSVRVYGTLHSASQGGEGTTIPQHSGVTKVLFIGNSFMYYNTSWNMFKDIAALHGRTVQVTAATNGGQNLIYQSTAGNVLDAIKKDVYDIVILQDKVGSNFQKSTFLEGCADIIPIIKQYSPNAKLAFYEPWPTKDQIDSKMAYFTESYIEAANKYNAYLAPAGEGFYELYKKDGLNYYCSDNRHPQPLGTFNSASTIYYALFPSDPYITYTSAQQTTLDNIINNNVAYTNEGQQSSYNLATLNKINAYAYKYSKAVIPAVEGRGTYTSVASGGVVANPTGGEQTTIPETSQNNNQDNGVMDVLFIGNSMTYYNNLAKVVKGIAGLKGHTINCTAATNGGQNLIYQSTASNILTAVQNGSYDVIILQDIVGGFDADKLEQGARQMISVVKQYQPNAEIVFYEPWPTKDTISGTGSLLPYFTNSYIKTAKASNAKLAPAGEAFYELYKTHGLDYYCADNKHPQPLGTFTSAATIYYTLFTDEVYGAFSSGDQSALDNLINTNVAYTDEGKQSSYSLETMNLIMSLGHKYARNVAPAVAGNGTYTSVAGNYVDIDAQLNPNNLQPVTGTEINASEFTNNNLAQGKTAVASSQKQAASYAVDGNLSTRWESDFADGQWLYVDLGSKKAFDSVGFSWEGAYATKYYIQISDDAQNWTTVSYVTATSNKTVKINLSQTYNARYVRMYGSKRGTQYGYSFYEMGIWNSTGSEVPTEFPTEEPTTVKVEEPTTQASGGNGASIVTSNDIKIAGFQVSTTIKDSDGQVGGIRTVGQVEPRINNKQVKGWGMVYALREYDGTNNNVSDSDIVVNSNSEYVYSYQSTELGTINTILGDSNTATYYVMTMTFGGSSVPVLTAKYAVRAYAILEDGSYVYSDCEYYSIDSIAKLLYENCKMPTESRHNFLYNEILKKVYPDYKAVDYNWTNIVVKPKEIA
ncbi:MAG: hypothetical protein E7254_09505 [Lachnospiraceae bacterium]|nr:hypothetical protein [Lachnospiraceae bacterium]